jgi:DNA-binding transcriptional ArsR family regulator
MSLAAVSKHLKILDRARLIHRAKRGSFYYVSLNAEALMNAEQWIARYQKFWEGRLDSLSRMLEKEP